MGAYPPNTADLVADAIPSSPAATMPAQDWSIQRGNRRGIVSQDHSADVQSDMKRLSIAGSVVAVTIGALPAAAQTGSPSTPAEVEITPYVSFGSYPSSRVGAAIGFALTPNFSVEGEVGYRHSPLNSLSASASVLYHLPGNARFRPYLVGGVGLEEYATASGRPDGGIAIQPRTAFAINGGGGIKLPVDDTWGIRTDARWFNGVGRDAGERWRVYNGVTYHAGRR